jgi:DNA recombination protein RmuC
MEIALVVLGLVNIVLIYFIVKKPSSVDDSASASLLKQDITALSESVTKLKDSLGNQISDRIDRNNEQMQKSMMNQFKESTKLVTDVTQRLTKLDETNRRVVDVADELKTLQNVLQNPKQRGVLGEYYLGQVLENVLPPDRFTLQYKFKNGEVVDAVIYLEKGKILPIDSKFSLENYNRLLEEKDKNIREKLAAQFKADLKNRIDETSKYIRPNENCMDFAFMFIPSEAIYYDLLSNKVGASGTSARDLLEYAFRDKKVIIVSPSSFMAYLQTVLQGLRSLQIEDQAKEIQLRVGQLGAHIAAYETFMQKLGNSLGTSVSHYNTAHKELRKIDKDVMRIAQTDASVEPLILDKPQTDD